MKQDVDVQAILYTDPREDAFEEKKHTNEDINMKLQIKFIMDL